MINCSTSLSWCIPWHSSLITLHRLPVTDLLQPAQLLFQQPHPITHQTINQPSCCSKSHTQSPTTLSTQSSVWLALDRDIMHEELYVKQKWQFQQATNCTELCKSTWNWPQLVRRNTEWFLCLIVAKKNTEMSQYNILINTNMQM